MKLIQNAIKVVETGEIIKSSHKNDFQSFDLDGHRPEIFFDGGGAYYIDGGNSYFRTNLPKKSKRWVNYCLTDETPFEEILEMLVWGTYGIDGKKPLVYKPIKDLSYDHICAIMRDYEGQLDTIYWNVLYYWKNKKNPF